MRPPQTPFLSHPKPPFRLACSRPPVPIIHRKPPLVTPSGGRKSGWESAASSPFDLPVPFDPKHSKPKDDPAGPSSASPSLPQGPPSVAAACLQPAPPSLRHRTPFPHPDPATVPPTAPPSYGFHNLERRTIVLADGSIRSYFTLPPAPAGPSCPRSPPAWSQVEHPPLPPSPSALDPLSQRPPLSIPASSPTLSQCQRRVHRLRSRLWLPANPTS